MTKEFMTNYPFGSYPVSIVEKAVTKLFSPELYKIAAKERGFENGMEVEIFRFLLGKLQNKCVNYALVEQGIKIAVQLDSGEEIFIANPTTRKNDKNIH